MKSIEERAYEFACKNDKPSSFFCDLEKSYKVGATEQKAIDIEKACKVFKDFMWIQYGDRIDESMAMYWKESITKAMEE